MDYSAVLERADEADAQSHRYVQLYATTQESSSWLGGRPFMPANIAWPIGDGEPYRFLAQIDCSVLPSDIWEGLGPRTGWLLIFGGYNSGTMDYRIVHTTELGVEKQPHSIPKEFYGHDEFESKKVPLRFEVADKIGRTFGDEPGVLAVIGGRRDKFHPGIEISDPLNALLFETKSNAELGWEWQGGLLTITVAKKSLSTGKFNPVIFDMGG